MLQEECVMLASTTEANNCLELAKMRILHHNAVTDEQYMKGLYPLSVAMYNMGGSVLCYSFFTFAQLLLTCIWSQLTIKMIKI